jgi:YggT family protein
MAQGILQLTSPLINPLRRIIPAIGRIDTATVLLALAVQAIAVTVVLLLAGMPLSVRFILMSSVLELIKLSLLLFTFAIIIRIVLSWIAPGTYNPTTALITNLTEPILRPFRRMLPAFGGFDLSPIFAIILLGALSILVEDSRSFFL